MTALNSVQRRLDKKYNGAVRAELSDGVLTLSGELPRWSMVVDAGRMCVQKKKYSIVNNIVCTNEPRPEMTMPKLKDSVLEGRSFDVVVIGGGIVGCAVARELKRFNISVAVIEKCHDVAMQASSRNDGMVHPGVDLKKGSLKHKYNNLGNAMYPQVCNELGVKFKRTGQILCFNAKWAKFILPLATPYWNRWLGVPCRYLKRDEVLRQEPHLAEDIKCGLSFPSAGVVCPYGLTIAYAENAADNGAEFFLDTAVTGMEVQQGEIKALHTNRGSFTAKVIINAAGVFSDRVAEMAGDRFFSIHPRKGTNTILDKKAAFQVRTIASMFGTADTKVAHTKGGGIVSTVDGNLLIGPDAREIADGEDYSTEYSSVENTFKRQGGVLPSLSLRDGITYFSGVRAPTYEEDFVICKGRRTKNIVHAAGIQSPGLTAAPAIAVDVAKMAVEILGGAEKNKNFDPVRKPVPRTAELSDEERERLIRLNPDYGIIVCRCEEISRGEILDALHRSIPCDTVDGVKRRVRAGMGRCQGGFCGPQVAQIIAEDKKIAMEEVKKSGDGSWMLCRDTKEADLDD